MAECKALQSVNATNPWEAERDVNGNTHNAAVAAPGFTSSMQM